MSQPGSAPTPSVDQPSVSWITNVSAPYRHPVWSSIADRAPLRVGLLTTNEPNRQWSADLPAGVTRLPLRAVSRHLGELHLYLLLRPALAARPDVVVLPGWETPAAWQLLLEARLRGVRTVAFYESASGSHRFSAGPVARLRALFFRQVDAVLTVGAASEEAVLGFGVDPARVVATRNAVDVLQIRDLAREHASDTGDRSARFVYVGQLIPRKNVAALIEAVAQLPGSSLVIAGEGPDEAALRQLTTRWGVADRVDFVGYVPYEEVPAVLAGAGTLVLPSTNEVYGLVVLEALAAGLHVVVSQACGVYADVRDLPGVFPAAPHADALAEAMRRSADGWHGLVDQPAVIARTPEAMADDVLWACVVARSRQ